MTQMLKQLSNHFPYYFLLMFIHFLERKGEPMQTKEGQREREGDRKSEVGSALTAESSIRGSNSRTLRS